MDNNMNQFQTSAFPYPVYQPYMPQPMYQQPMYQQRQQMPPPQMQPVQQPQQTDIFSQILERLDRIEKQLSSRPQKNNYRKEGENNV